MNDLNEILDNTYSNLNKENNINILEIGTGKGQNSTLIIYNFFKNKNLDFNLISYEGDNKYFNIANKYWKNNDKVKIINEFFTKKEDIKSLLIPNLPEYIIDYKETNIRFINKYLKLYNNFKNPFTNNINIPDIIFIDCSRFMHLPIINLCYELFNSNPECIYIIEDDYFINNIYGELNIIQKYFKLDIIKKYEKKTWQWPFVIFKIKEKIN
jgi:hypothetical protein|tara:strand:+ start:365 stop:1000 length:636 start_codon:yes stop_codon:yes gene_type:complete